VRSRLWLVLLAALAIGGCRAAQEAAPQGGRSLLAVAAYNNSAYGREIQLVGLDGKRVRIDAHAPLPFGGSLSPDGSRIVFTGGEGPSNALDLRNLYTSRADGTDVRLLYSAKDVGAPTWSPDGKWVAFTLADRPWVVRSDGRGAHRLTGLLVDAWPAWSPDSRALAFSGARANRNSALNWGVHTIRIDGSGLRRLTRRLTDREIADEAGIVDIEWAPDGSRIAFVRASDSAPDGEVDTVDATGRNEHRIGHGQCPVWSPAGRRLAYAPPPGGVALVQTGGRPRRIATVKGSGCPAWIADGRRILFFTGTRTAHIVDVQTGALRTPSADERRHVRLVPNSAQTWSRDGKFLTGDGTLESRNYVADVWTLRRNVATFRWSDDHAPAWSPDGRRLAFVRTQQTDHIVVSSADGRRAARLAEGADPSWSPDGKWIAFDRHGRVFVVPSGGGTARPIGRGVHPVWSPDGSRLAATGGGVFVIDRGSGVETRVDRGLGAGRGGVQPPYDRPAWSHDGTRLAFSYWVEDAQDDYISLVGADGSQLHTLAAGRDPEWSPDDVHLAFVSGYLGLKYIAASGGTADVLDTRSVTSFALSPDGTLVAYSVNGPDQFDDELWLVGVDGSRRAALLQGGSDTEPTWRPR
jgi:Tol biopolymer transport system component